MRATKSSKSKKAVVGVAIVGYNNEEILPNCLDSLQSQTYNHIRTIVLDNNSSDQSISLVKHKYPWVNLIESKANTGFAKGNNIIIEQFIKDKDVKYIVLLNSDASLAKHWVEKLVEFAEGKENIAFLQGLTLDYYNHDVVDSTHIYINRKGQAIQSGYRQLKKSAPPNPEKVFGVNAAACMISKSFLEQQPFGYLFDEDFFMYLEDVDIAARAVVLGWESYYVPAAVAYHVGSASSGKSPGYSVYMVNRNRWPLLIKNLPAGVIIKIIPRMVIGDIQELYRIARAKNYLIIRKFILGRIKGFFAAFGYLKKRQMIIKSRRVNSKELWDLMDAGIKSG